MIEKGSKVAVTSNRSGKEVIVIIVDIDYEENKLWARLPTNHIVIMKLDAKTGKYLGKVAGIEIVLDPNQI
jgi:hypothetical protein